MYFSPSDPPFISSLDNLHLLDNIPSEYHSAIRTIYSLGLLDDFFDLFSTGDIRISRAQACIVINRLSSYLTPGNKTTLSGLIIGGQLTVSETTPIDAKILLSNAGCDVFSYSAILALKYYKEGSWVDIPFNSPDNTVSEVAILHQLMPGQEKVFTFDLSYYYGSISEGYYKLEIVLTQNGKTTLYRISFYQQLIYVQLTLSGKRTWNDRIPSPLFLYFKNTVQVLLVKFHLPPLSSSSLLPMPFSSTPYLCPDPENMTAAPDPAFFFRCWRLLAIHLRLPISSNDLLKRCIPIKLYFPCHHAFTPFRNSSMKSL